MSRTCHDCDRTGAPGARFCDECGRVLPDAQVVASRMDSGPDETRGDRPRRPSRWGVTATLGLVLLLGSALLAGLGPLDAWESRGGSGPDGGAADGRPTADGPNDEGLHEGETPEDDRVPGSAGADAAVRIDELDRPGSRRSDTGLACDDPAGPDACINLVTDLGLDPDDEVRLIRGQVIIATPDGRLRAAGLRDGGTRWRHTVSGQPILHPVVADVLPVGHADGVDLLRLDGGDVLGRLDLDARAVGGVGPWVVTASDDEVASWSVSGSRGWRREVPPDGDVRFGGEAAALVTHGRLEVLYGNTGTTRVTVEVEGEPLGFHRHDDRTTVVTERPAAVVQADRDGAIASRVRLPGTQVLTHEVDPSERRLVTLSTDDDGRTHWVTIVELAADPRPRYVPLPGPAPSVAPLVDRDEVVVARRGPRRHLQRIGLESGATRTRVPLARDAIGLGRAPSGALVVLDDLGSVRLFDTEDGEQRRRVELGTDARPIEGHPLLVRRGGGIVALADLP